MKLSFLITGSDPEPVPGKRAVSLALETGEYGYLFDAGEPCAERAQTSGIDLLRMRAIFISHCHMSHIGGLPMLLWNMRQFARHGDAAARKGAELTLCMPHILPWHGMLEMLEYATDMRFAQDYVLEVDIYRDGTIFDDGAVRVEALHNLHMGRPHSRTGWRSYSFRIEAEGRSLVYSGDVTTLAETLPLVREGCDLFLLEPNGEPPARSVEILREAGVAVERLGFLHYDVQNRDELESLCASLNGDFAPFIAADGDTLEL
jgi:ribonuclease BN (tRNA processing enzyme)